MSMHISKVAPSPFGKSTFPQGDAREYDPDGSAPHSLVMTDDIYVRMTGHQRPTHLQNKAKA